MERVMGRVVTIVAVNPANFDDFGAGPGEEEAIPEEKEGDFSIKMIVRALCRHKSKDFVVWRAATLAHVREILDRDLNTHPTPPALVQIIGHGRPGVLSLGSHWNGKETGKEEDGDKGAVYLLDSNLNRYMGLLTAVQTPTRVWLLGCEVGSSEESTGVANGPTLVFDLSQLWGCAVSAPVYTVGPHDFEKTGRFARTGCMITAEGRSVTADPPRYPGEAPREGVGAQAKKLLERGRRVDAV